MAIERVCAHPDCKSKVSSTHVLCGHHWFAVPPRVKAAMQERIHGWKNRGAAVEFYISFLTNRIKQGAS